MVPLIQVSTDAKAQADYSADLDLATADVNDLLALIVEVVSRRYIPKYRPMASKMAVRHLKTQVLTPEWGTQR